MASGLLTELVDGTIIEYNKEIFCRPKKVFLYENQKTPIRKGFFESNKVSRLLPVTNHIPRAQLSWSPFQLRPLPLRC